MGLPSGESLCLSRDWSAVGKVEPLSLEHFVENIGINNIPVALKGPTSVKGPVVLGAIQKCSATHSLSPLNSLQARHRIEEENKT